MANNNPQGGNNDTQARPKAEVSVSVAQQPVPKLPHEHDESVESQVGGQKPGTANSNSAPGIKPRVKEYRSKQSDEFSGGAMQPPSECEVSATPTFIADYVVPAPPARSPAG